jgi:hypothetical protein
LVATKDNRDLKFWFPSAAPDAGAKARNKREPQPNQRLALPFVPWFSASACDRTRLARG